MDISFKGKIVFSNDQMLLTIPKAFKEMIAKFTQTEEVNVYISDGHQS
jgi:hypothetical protein